MSKEITHKKIQLKDDLEITILPLGKHSKLFEIDALEAEKFGEAPIQILEAKRYEYELSNSSYQLRGDGDTCFPSKSTLNSRGTITPGNYVGTLELVVAKKGEKDIPFFIEVLATKFDATNNFDKSYRTNYRSMLESITEKCTELLMQANSPVNQYFEPNFEKENETIYQRFSFIKSILNSNEFEESVMKIISSPKTNWINKEEIVDIRSIKRFTNQNVKDLIKGNSRIPLPIKHPLYAKGKLESIPSKISSYRQESSLDNPENRFIKHALQTYLHFCEKCKYVFKENSKDQKESVNLIYKLESFLNHSFFKDISRPTTLKLNSPSLQRKSGYRQVLKSWLIFDLASKLTWRGGEDVYESGKRDIATLYEYWLFFVLYDLFKEKFDLNHLEHEDRPYNHLFETTKHGLNLIIKSGQHTALSGTCLIKNRALNIKFSFNRTFSGNKDNFPKPGSWTTSMRPDYTLSVWPSGLDEFRNDKGEKTAEEQEQIVHIHFDAKYKVNHFSVKTNKKDVTEISKELERKELNKTKKEERAGVFKNADLLKMHAYKDAIRRTGGSYILYPGNKETRFKGFHELIPGLGAFSLNPKNENEDILSLSTFIDEVIDHLINNASQRENLASKLYTIHKNGTPNIIKQRIPEYINGEKLIPDETHVLIGFYNTQEQYNWIKKGKYNFRLGSGKGSLILDKETVSASYLLLHTHGDKLSGDIWKITSKGPKVYSKENLIEKGYPNPQQDFYLVIDIEQVDKTEFKYYEWEFKNLKNYNYGHASAKPFTASLTELLSVKKNK
ncbi:DUF2357 domain-containing protein [Flavobacteriaceae bacterium]|nr:DUF2357 domain-containing protein [Flavobacteriaceae bacterium]